MSEVKKSSGRIKRKKRTFSKKRKYRPLDKQQIQQKKKDVYNVTLAKRRFKKKIRTKGFRPTRLIQIREATTREISLENVMEIYESPPLDDPYNLVYWTFCSISAVSWLPSHVLMMNIEWFYPNESLQHLTTLFYWCIAVTALSGLCFQVISKDKSSACSCWLTLPVSRVRGGLLLLTLITLLILQANSLVMLTMLGFACAFVTSLLNFSLYSIGAQFPNSYLQVILMGDAGRSLFATILYLLTKGIYGETDGHNQQPVIMWILITVVSLMIVFGISHVWRDKAFFLFFDATEPEYLNNGDFVLLNEEGGTIELQTLPSTRVTTILRDNIPINSPLNPKNENRSKVEDMFTAFTEEGEITSSTHKDLELNQVSVSPCISDDISSSQTQTSIIRSVKPSMYENKDIKYISLNSAIPTESISTVSGSNSKAEGRSWRKGLRLDKDHTMRLSILQVARKLQDCIISLLINSILTYSVSPGLISHFQPEIHTELGEMYPMICLATFQIGDFIGRYIVNNRLFARVTTSLEATPLTQLTLGRVPLTALMILTAMAQSIIGSDASVGILAFLANDYFALLIVFVFGFSHGYIICRTISLAARQMKPCAPSDDRLTASILICSIYTAMALGESLSTSFLLIFDET